jgi:hypothetical protein
MSISHLMISAAALMVADTPGAAPPAETPAPARRVQAPVPASSIGISEEGINRTAPSGAARDVGIQEEGINRTAPSGPAGPGEPQALRAKSYNSSKSNNASLVVQTDPGRVPIGTLLNDGWSIYDIGSGRWAIVCGSTSGYTFGGSEDAAAQAAAQLCAASASRVAATIALQPAETVLNGGGVGRPTPVAPQRGRQPR